MENLIIAGQFVLSLSILVVLHEMGHFIPAKLFKTKVEKFYLFFDYKFSLFKKKIGETVYGIGWIPLGGYVKIAGMIDESLDTDQMKKPVQPWEFRAKPAWQRLIIMLGGVIVNLLLGWVIYIGVFAYWGKEIVPTTGVKNGFSVDVAFQKYGFREGDQFLLLNNLPIEDVSDLGKQLFLRSVNSITVKHVDGKIEKINLPENIGEIMFTKGIMNPFTPRFKSVIDSVIPKSPADIAGLMKGDQVVAVNHQKTAYWGDFTNAIKANKGTLAVDILRNNTPIQVQVTPDKSHKIGVTPLFNVEEVFTIKKVNYSIIESVSKGSSEAYWTLNDYVAQFKYVFTKKGAGQVGGMIAIAKIFNPVWDWQSFWKNTAFLSIMLAFMNLLPIPALDGGHVMFTLYEIITKRKPSDKFLEYAQITGFILIMSLVVFANGKDILQLFLGN